MATTYITVLSPPSSVLPLTLSFIPGRCFKAAAMTLLTTPSPANALALQNLSLGANLANNVTKDILPCQEDFLRYHITPCHRLSSDIDCGICLERLVVGPDVPRSDQAIFIKPCKHFFHAECILTWHTSIRPERDTCPICRRVL